jgi:hypothetical protein
MLLLRWITGPRPRAGRLGHQHVTLIVPGVDRDYLARLSVSASSGLVRGSNHQVGNEEASRDQEDDQERDTRVEEADELPDRPFHSAGAQRCEAPGAKRE